MKLTSKDSGAPDWRWWFELSPEQRLQMIRMMRGIGRVDTIGTQQVNPAPPPPRKVTHEQARAIYFKLRDGLYRDEEEAQRGDELLRRYISQQEDLERVLRQIV